MVVPPGDTVATPSVFVIDRSTTGQLITVQACTESGVPPSNEADVVTQSVVPGATLGSICDW